MSFQTDLYDGLIEDIYSLTNRPDLDGETKIALRAATQNAHLTDTYFRDVVTTQVQIPNAANIVALNIPTLFPGFRGLSKIRPLDINMNLIALTQDRQVEVVEFSDIYDVDFGNIRNNIAYAAGDSVIVRCPISNWGYAIEYLRAPQTSRELYNSWIAQDAPAIIQYWASALVLQTNGNEDKANAYLGTVEKLYIPQLKSNYLLSAIR